MSEKPLSEKPMKEKPSTLRIEIDVDFSKPQEEIGWLISWAAMMSQLDFIKVRILGEIPIKDMPLPPEWQMPKESKDKILKFLSEKQKGEK